MDPSIIQLDTHVSGDTWQGVPVIGPIQIQSGAALANFPYPAASVRLTLSRVFGGKTPLTLSTANPRMAPINITNAAEWSMVIPPVADSVWAPEPGRYQGHYEVTDTQGTRITLYDVRLTVLADKTP